jgi:peroxiredoxin
MQMSISKKLATLLSSILLLGALAYARADADTAAHTKVGDQMPSISVHEVSGDTFTTSSEIGKVVVINFWATWCGPCRLEMPRLENEIWQKYQSLPDFAMVAIAREQSRAEVFDFQKHHPFTFPLAYDEDRTTYALFADSGIPRTYVVDKHGRIVFQTYGYDPQNFTRLNNAIEKALAAN